MSACGEHPKCARSCQSYMAHAQTACGCYDCTCGRAQESQLPCSPDMGSHNNLSPVPRASSPAAVMQWFLASEAPPGWVPNELLDLTVLFDQRRKPLSELSSRLRQCTSALCS
jgi:hypothetical protein